MITWRFVFTKLILNARYAHARMLGHAYFETYLVLEVKGGLTQPK